MEVSFRNKLNLNFSLIFIKITLTSFLYTFSADNLLATLIHFHCNFLSRVEEFNINIKNKYFDKISKKYDFSFSRVAVTKLREFNEILKCSLLIKFCKVD